MHVNFNMTLISVVAMEAVFLVFFKLTVKGFSGFSELQSDEYDSLKFSPVEGKHFLSLFFFSLLKVFEYCPNCCRMYIHQFHRILFSCT
jgi:hypothetical protein